MPRAKLRGSEVDAQVLGILVANSAVQTFSFELKLERDGIPIVRGEHLRFGESFGHFPQRLLRGKIVGRKSSFVKILWNLDEILRVLRQKGWRRWRKRKDLSAPICFDLCSAGNRKEVSAGFEIRDLGSLRQGDLASRDSFVVAGQLGLPVFREHPSGPSSDFLEVFPGRLRLGDEKPAKRRRFQIRLAEEMSRALRSRVEGVVTWADR